MKETFRPPPKEIGIMTSNNCEERKQLAGLINFGFSERIRRGRDSCSESLQDDADTR